MGIILDTVYFGRSTKIPIEKSIELFHASKVNARRVKVLATEKDRQLNSFLEISLLSSYYTPVFGV